MSPVSRTTVHGAMDLANGHDFAINELSKKREQLSNIWIKKLKNPQSVIQLMQ